MTEIFGDVYAASYDAIYGSKDYEAECSMLEDAFERWGIAGTRTILDLGCGTGHHAVVLGGRGYNVTGVDRSPSMLALALERANAADVDNVRFLEGDVRSVDVGARFDVVLLMFAVLGYQLEDDDVGDTLRTARRHTVPGGLLIFDVWYGPAVLAAGPSDRVKVVMNGDAEIERHASGRLDGERNRCTVAYTLVIKGPSASVTHETHTVRYFFEDELRRFLRDAGYELIQLSAFPDLDRPPSEASWNVIGIAQAV